jgi:hypothetical protein
VEIRVAGEKVPVYEDTLEDLGRFNEQPVLPFNAYGTLAVARAEFDNNSGSSQVGRPGRAAPAGRWRGFIGGRSAPLGGEALDAALGAGAPRVRMSSRLRCPPDPNPPSRRCSSCSRRAS